jgi:hypothetical protein
VLILRELQAVSGERKASRGALDNGLDLETTQRSLAEILTHVNYYLIILFECGWIDTVRLKSRRFNALTLAGAWIAA